VTYKIEYEDLFCSNTTAPSTVQVQVKRGSTGLSVMEQAVTKFGTPFRFSATYHGARLGYFIDAINGTESDQNTSCIWLLFIRRPDGREFLSPVGVSNIRIPGNGYSIIWRLTQTEDI
jgi:hypothetical protein